MSLIHEAQCPFCGSTLPIRVLWDFARLEESQVLPGLGFLGRSGLLRGKIGVACPNCRAKFRVLQTRIVLVRVLIWGALVAGAVGVGSGFVDLLRCRSERPCTRFSCSPI